MRQFYARIAHKLEAKSNIDLQYYLRGGGWLSITQIVTIVAGILTTSFFAFYLSENSYGIYRYLIGLAAILSSFSLTGLGQSILQTAAKKYYGFYKETVRLNFIYSLLITAISLLGAAYYFFNENITLSFGCVLIAIFQPVINAFQNTQSFLQGSRRYREATFTQGSKVLLVSLASFSALYFSENIVVLFLVYLLASSVVNIIFHLIYRPQNVEIIPHEVYSNYLAYAKSTSIRNIISSVSNRLDSILVFTQLGAAELAIYSIAIIIPEQIKASFKNLTALLLPKYSIHTDASSLKSSVSKRSFQLFIILTVITFVYILVAPFLYNLLFPKYHEAIFYSQLYALAFPTFILLIPYTVLQAQLAEKQLYRITMYSSLFQIIVQVIFIFFLGLLGAVIAKIVYRIFLLLIVFRELRNI